MPRRLTGFIGLRYNLVQPGLQALKALTLCYRKLKLVEGDIFYLYFLCMIGRGFFIELCNLEVVVMDSGPLPDNLLKTVYINTGAIIAPFMFVAP